MSRIIPISIPKHRPPVDFQVHRDDEDMEEDERYFEKLSLIKFPTTPQIVAPLDVKFDIHDKKPFQVANKNKGTGMKKEIVVPTSSGFSRNVVPVPTFHTGQSVVADKQKRNGVGGVNQVAGYKLGTGPKMTQAKVPKDPYEEHDKLTRELLQCKEVLVRKGIADPEDIRRATYLLHQASLRLSKLGYRRTPSEQEGSSSSSNSSSPSGQSKAPEKKTKNVKKKN